MRIAGIEEFLTQPLGTVFCKYDPCIFGDLCIYEGRVCPENTDFYYTPITNIVDAHSDSALFDKLDKAEKDPTISLDFSFEETSRDGMFVPTQLFAIWEEKDLVGFIKCITDTLERFRKGERSENN